LFGFTINGTMSVDDNEPVNCFTLDREPLPELSLGADKVVSAVQERIERHFEKLDRGEYEEPLVVGILGEWGSGKTLWLKSIENAFAERLESEVNRIIKSAGKSSTKSQSDSQSTEHKDSDTAAKADSEKYDWPDSITIPVFFNAWRYEKEEHLIYPLIKVLERKIGAVYASVEDCLGKDAATSKETDKRNGNTRPRSGFLRYLKGAWESSRRLLAATGAGIVALGSGITISGKLKTSNPILSGLFGNEVGVQISGKSITDLLISMPKIMREEAEAGRAAAAEAKGRNGEEEGQEQEAEDATTQSKAFASLPEDLLELAERARSDYYDFHSVLRSLTGRKAGTVGPKINLLFFIDDLDRCLPEKAVEMLEAIKLFLEVEGTAFVLALDDEVVERGIAHRYRDYADAKHPTAWDSIAYSLKPERYREFLGLYADNLEEPITGHEYMEKIVHLQVRIPRVQEVDVKTYLLEKYPNIFGAQSMGRENEYADADRAGEAFGELEEKLEEQTGDKKRSDKGGKGRPRPGKDAGAQSVRTQLLELFADAVPPVPRKLIRATELLSLKIEVARKNGWDPAADENELYILAQLAIVQLFAPELYRFALKNRFFTFLQRLEGWLEERHGKKSPPSNHCLEELERAYRDAGLTGKNGRLPDSSQEKQEGEEKTSPDTVCQQKPIEFNPRLVERMELPLVDLVIRARRQRSGFDPFDVVLKNPEGLYNDRALEKFFTLRPPKEESKGAEQKPVAGAAELPIIEPEDPLFVEQITSTEPAYWQNALQDPGVQGKRGRLAEKEFKAILERLPQLSGSNLLVQWLEVVEPLLSTEQRVQLLGAVARLLSAKQLDELVAKTKILSQLLEEETDG